MNYRTLFLEYLANFSEYQYNWFQLVLLHKKDQEDIFKAINNIDEVEVYQARYAKVFYKTLPFNAINGSVAELIFTTYQTLVLKVEDIVSNYKDCFSGKNLSALDSKYLIIYPIIDEKEALGAFFIYSNYPTPWQISDNQVFSLIENLQNANNTSKEEEINQLLNNNNWIYQNKSRSYCSSSLAKELNIKQYNENYDFKGCSLRKLSEQEYENGLLTSCEVVKSSPIYSLMALGNVHYAKYTYLYFRSDEDYINKLLNTLKKLDGKLGSYEIYQVNVNTYIVLFPSVLNINSINNAFEKFDYVLVRSGHEIYKKVDFTELTSYLNLSPITPFDSKLYDFYLEKLFEEKANQVRANLNPSKIKINPVINSKSAAIGAYFIQDIKYNNHYSKDNKQKSLKAMLKICEEYAKYDCILYLHSAYFIDNGKFLNSHFNLLKEYCEEHHNLYLVCEYSDALLKMIDRMPQLINKIFLMDVAKPFELLSFIKNVKGVFINNDEYLNLLKQNEEIAVNYCDFLLQYTKLVFVQIPQNNITKFHNEHIMLVCE